MKNIKTILYSLCIATVFGSGIFGSSCSKWTEPEAKDFFEEPSAEYKAGLKEYFKSDHKKMFGWFGNWSGKGGSMDGRLVGLPDSLDFVSLWLCWGNINEAQQADLKEFQDRGSKAILCWRAASPGDNLTPTGVNSLNFWLEEADRRELSDYDFEGEFEGTVGTNKEVLRAAAYAMAIVDTVRKYNVDGFDYDIEDWGSLMSRTKPEIANTFMKILRHEFTKDGRMLVADIPGGTSWLTFYDVLSDEVILSLDHIIWQTYDLVDGGLDNFFEAVKNHHPNVFEDVIRKSIVTATFEEAAKKWRFSQQALWTPSCGLDFGGIGAYHIEYDYAGKPDYPVVRAAIQTMNPAGKKEEVNE